MENGKVCPRCGTTAESFAKTSLLGCAECYLVFREEILKTVSLIQGKALHVGKVPAAGTEEKHTLVLEAELLKKRIERAFKEEDFAKAEEMSARLKELNRLLERVEGAK